MKAFTTLCSRVIPLPRDDTDTDLIIPAQYLTSTSREGFGEGLFKRLREADPSFPLNLPEFKEAKILLAQKNFGCGSSREHAVWALMSWGIEVVIASSFADIFKGNSGKNGLVLVELLPKQIQELQKRASEGIVELEVDLEHQMLRGPDFEWTFPYDAFRKECLLKGYDDFDYLVAHQREIEAYQQNREKELFYKTTDA